MASLMKHLMDEFYVLSQVAHESGDYESEMAYELAMSHANNGHQKTNAQLLDDMERVLTSLIDMDGSSDAEIAAWHECLTVIDEYRVKLDIPKDVTSPTFALQKRGNR